MPNKFTNTPVSSSQSGRLLRAPPRCGPEKEDTFARRYTTKQAYPAILTLSSSGVHFIDPLSSGPRSFAHLLTLASKRGWIRRHAPYSLSLWIDGGAVQKENCRR